MVVMGPKVEFLASFNVAAAVAGEVTAGEVARALEVANKDTNAVA